MAGSLNSDFVTTSPEPELDVVTKTCTVCQKPFLTYSFDFGSRPFAPVKICENCTISVRAREAEDEREKLKKARLIRFNAICPEVYRSDEIRAAMNAAFAPKSEDPNLLDTIRESVKRNEGVLVIGHSGKFKTTAVFNAAVRYLILTGHEVEYLTAAKFRQRASEASKDCTVEAFVRALARIEWLFLDDVGNMSTTPAACEALLDLLEERMNKRKPILATSQFGGEQLIAKFPNPQMGQAIVRRLSMVATPILFP